MAKAISEVIAELEAIRAAHGDMLVEVMGYDGRYTPCDELRIVSSGDVSNSFVLRLTGTDYVI